jgi:hypothetical protein
MSVYVCWHEIIFIRFVASGFQAVACCELVAGSLGLARGIAEILLAEREGFVVVG